MAVRSTHVAVCLAVVPAIMGVLAMFAESGSNQVRSVRYARGRPIASLIKPDDTELVIVSSSSPPLIVTAPPGTSEIEWETHNADVVLQLRVDNVEPTLTDSGDWIETKVSAVVVDILKSTPKRSFSAGERVGFMADGGEIKMIAPSTNRPITVKAEVPWSMPFQPGVDYLAFGWIPEDEKLVISPHAAYELTSDGHLRSLLRHRPADEVNGAPASQILEQIRLASRRGKAQ